MDKKTNCEHIQEKLSQYLDSELPDNVAQLVAQHIKNCIGCAHELEKLRETDRIGKADVFPDPGKKFWINQRKKIHASINDDDRAAIVHEFPGRKWTRTFIGSYGIRTAIGLSAAAVLILFVVKEVYRDDFPVRIESPSQLQESEPTGDTYPAESAGQQEKAPIVEKKVPDEAVPYQKIPEELPEYRQSPQVSSFTTVESRETQEPIEETPAQQSTQPSGIRTPETTTQFSISGAKEKAQIPPAHKVPKSALMPSTLSPGLGKLNLTPATQKTQPDKIENGDDEFDTYLERQSTIKTLRDPIEQKNQWAAFLQTLKSPETRDLVVYELYEIYYNTVNRSSPLELKKEALDFFIQYKVSIENFLGISLYKERLSYFEKLL